TVIRRLFGDDHVVHVALAETLRRDANESRALLQLADRTRADVAHAGAKTSDELIENRRERAAIRNASLDAFRNELLVRRARLAVAIFAALLHRAERAHASIHFVRATLVENHVAGCLVGAREERAHHHAARARGDRFHHVARELHAAVRNDRNAATLRCARAL